jgi:hypothetical protein
VYVKRALKLKRLILITGGIDMNTDDQLEIIKQRKRMELYVLVYGIWAPRRRDYTGDIAKREAKEAVGNFDAQFNKDQQNE